MRYFCVVLAIVAMPLSAGAQQHPRPAQPPLAAMGSIGLPLPPIGLPAINYPKPWEWPVPRPAWELPQVPAWERQAPPAWERGHVGRPIQPVQPIRRPRHGRDQVVFVPYGYGYGMTSGVPYVIAPAVGPGAAPEPPPQPVSDTGFLRLEVEPAVLLQIYVDGVFVGTPADMRGEVELRSGAHRIEIRAPGYEPLTFDARIEADRGITYRGDLRASATQPVPTAPIAPLAIPTGNRTLYVIPGCYLGNVMPEASRLPTGCDISKMKTHTP